VRQDCGAASAGGAAAPSGPLLTLAFRFAAKPGGLCARHRAGVCPPAASATSPLTREIVASSLPARVSDHFKPQSVPLEQTAYGIGGLGTRFQPVEDPGFLRLDHHRLLARFIPADHFKKAAASCSARIGGHDVVHSAFSSCRSVANAIVLPTFLSFCCLLLMNAHSPAHVVKPSTPAQGLSSCGCICSYCFKQFVDVLHRAHRFPSRCAAAVCR